MRLNPLIGSAVILYAITMGIHSHAAPSSPETAELIPQLSIMSPSQFRLSNDSFTIPYETHFTGFPLVSIAMERHLFYIATLEVRAHARVGYGYKYDIFDVHDTAGRNSSSGIALHWLPTAGGVRLTHEIPGFAILKPSLGFGAGVDFLHQSSGTKGISGGVSIPFVFINPLFTFLEGVAPKDWFGGFTFGITYRHSLGRQAFRGVSVDLGVSVLL